MEGSESWLSLSDFIAGLRAELRAAHNDAPEDDAQPGDDADVPRFIVVPVSVEFAMTAKKEAGGKGGVRFYVFELGASGSVASEATQRVSLQLTPVNADGDPWNVSGETTATQE